MKKQIKTNKEIPTRTSKADVYTTSVLYNNMNRISWPNQQSNHSWTYRADGWMWYFSSVNQLFTLPSVCMLTEQLTPLTRFDLGGHTDLGETKPQDLWWSHQPFSYEGCLGFKCGLRSTSSHSRWRYFFFNRKESVLPRSSAFLSWFTRCLDPVAYQHTHIPWHLPKQPGSDGHTTAS